MSALSDVDTGDGPAVERVGTAAGRGWVLRLVLFAIALAAAALTLAAAGDVPAVSLAGIVTVLLSLLSATAPGSPAPLLLLIGIVCYRLAEGAPRIDGVVMVLAALALALHQLAGIAAWIPWSARFNWSMLRPAALRYLAAIVPVEVAMALVLALR